MINEKQLNNSEENQERKPDEQAEQLKAMAENVEKQEPMGRQNEETSKTAMTSRESKMLSMLEAVTMAELKIFEQSEKLGFEKAAREVGLLQKELSIRMEDLVPDKERRCELVHQFLTRLEKESEEYRDLRQKAADAYGKARTGTESQIKKLKEETTQEANQETKFADAKNFDELSKLIREQGKLLGSDGIRYYADEIVDLIDMSRMTGNTDIITRTQGLRDKVEELLAKEGKIVFNSPEAKKMMAESMEKSLKLDAENQPAIGENVAIKKSNGEIETTGWYIDDYDSKTGLYNVVKKDKRGSGADIKRGISSQDLYNWALEAGWSIKRK